MKTRKTIIVIIIAIAGLSAIAWLGSPSRDKRTGNQSATASNPSGSVAGESAGALQAEETSFNFGAISMSAGNVSRSFKIKNAGAGPVIIEKLYTSCMCTIASLEMGGRKFGPYGMQGHGFIPKISQSLNPGEEAFVEVVFDPAAHGPAGIGRIQRDIIIENNAGDPLLLNITAQVTP